MKLRIYLVLFISVITSASFADTVWHCSRDPLQKDVNTKQPADNQFSLAAVSNATDVIHISLRDLYDVFSGINVQLSGVSLSACFRLDDEELTEDALKSLGLPLSTVQRMAKQASIVNSHFYSVRSENEMSECIGKHYPAIGYLNNPLNTEHMAPCF